MTTKTNCIHHEKLWTENGITYSRCLKCGAEKTYKPEAKRYHRFNPRMYGVGINKKESGNGK